MTVRVCLSFAAALVLAGCLQGPASSTGGEFGGLDGVRQAVRSRYADVKPISPDELARWLADPSRAKPLLIDARRPDEFAASHLPGAIRVDPSRDPCTQVKGTPPTQPIVVYCSVGWRSAEAARRLQRGGFLDVANLDGSIFQWAIEGRRLVNTRGNVVQVVHPFDDRWGALLPPNLRSRPPGG